MSELPSRRRGIGANKYTAYTYVTDTEKRCSLCEVIKPLSDFHKDTPNKHGRNTAYYCKECANRKSREHHARRMLEVPDYRRQKKRAYIKERFGISLEEYENKLVEQNFRCSLCDLDLAANPRMAHLDHCHATGKVREFLCTNCNQGLGHFKDNKDVLLNAIKYLAKHENSVVVLMEGSSP